MRYERTRLLLPVAGLTVALCVIQPGGAQSTTKWSLLALSKRDHTLAIVDPATLKIIARLPVGPDPHEVIASSDGKKAYVSITALAVITRFRFLTWPPKRRCPISILEP